MDIEAECKNCRFCKEMTGPYDTGNYYVCMRGGSALAVKPEGKCAHIVEGFEPTESLLRESLLRESWYNQLKNIVWYG